MDKLLRRVLPETIQIELNYQPGVYLVNADPTRLQQVFMNLAVNARDASADGGVLEFELDQVQILDEETHMSVWPRACTNGLRWVFADWDGSYRG